MGQALPRPISGLAPLVGEASRWGFALVSFLLALAVSSWGPLYARNPFGVRAMPLLAPALGLAAVAALNGRERPKRPWRAALGCWGVVIACLALLVVLRGPTGIPAQVSAPGGHLGGLPPGPVDLIGQDLDELHARKWTVEWNGAIRAPQTGSYRVWVQGRGRVEASLDGRQLLLGEGDPFIEGAEVLIGQGEHQLDVRLRRLGPGARLRLGWVRPGRGGRPGGRDEMIPPRLLGREKPAWLWWMIDGLAFVAALLVGLLVLLVPWDRPLLLGAPTPLGRREVGLCLAAYVVLVVLMSWPLALHPVTSGVVDRPDGRLNAWILAWDAHALVHSPGRVFEAPIFHPLPDALAFSENLLLPAALVAPAVLLYGPVLGYNLLLLASYALSGFGTYLLIRRVSPDPLAAFVGGAFFSVGAHRWIKMAHLHAQLTLFLPIALWAMDRFWEQRTLRRGLWVGLVLAFQGLSSIYMGAVTATALSVGLMLALLGGLRPSQTARVAAGLLVAILLMAPVAWPYFRMRQFQGVEWTRAEVASFATTLDSYLASASPFLEPFSRRHLDPACVRDPLFPGVVVMVLGVAGLASAPRRYRWMAIVASGTAVLISLGPASFVYRLLYDNVIFFRGIRALSRFSILPVLCLAVLSGLRVAGRGRLALAALLVFLVEARVPLGFSSYHPPPESARWLAGRSGAVAYLPLGERDTEAMLDGIAHFRPLVNGDSGFIPRPYTRAMELLEGPLSDDALRFLRAVDVSQLVTRDDRSLALLVRFDEDRIYEVPPGEKARHVVSGKPVASLWGSGGVVVDLGAPSRVSRIAFELDERSWVAHPRLAGSLDGISWTQITATASLADAILSLLEDPIHGMGEVRFAPETVRYLRLDRRLPAKPGLVWAERQKESRTDYSGPPAAADYGKR